MLDKRETVYENRKLTQTCLIWFNVTIWICMWQMNTTQTQVIKYNQTFLEADQPIGIQYSNQIELYTYILIIQMACIKCFTLLYSKTSHKISRYIHCDNALPGNSPLILAHYWISNSQVFDNCNNTIGWGCLTPLSTIF